MEALPSRAMGGKPALSLRSFEFQAHRLSLPQGLSSKNDLQLRIKTIREIKDDLNEFRFEAVSTKFKQTPEDFKSNPRCHRPEMIEAI